MDQISLTGLRAHGRHGVHDHERAVEQEFVVDLSVELSTARAASSDDLAETVDYSELAGKVASLVGGESVYLIETLAERIAEVAMEYDRTQGVTVTVHKPHAPLDVSCDDVSVTIHRQRTGRPMLRRIDGGMSGSVSAVA